MKKITSLIFAFMMALTLVPYTSFATEKTVDLSESYINPLYQDVITEADLKKPSDNGISTYSMQKYFTEESEVIEALREGMTQREEQITVYYFIPEQIQGGYLKSWIEQTYAETGNPKQGDYLRWHLAGASSSGSASVNQEGYRYTLNFTLTYYTSEEQEDKVDQAVASLIAELGVSDDMSDYEKLCAFYDYVCENVTYDHDNFEDNAYTLKYSAYAAIIDKTAVCQGYSNLMYRLLNEVGVKCRMISGQAGGPHGWNIVKLDDKYYLMDATWDAPRKAAGLAYKYFIKGTGEFSKDHTSDTEYMTAEFKAAYPISETDYQPCKHQWEKEYTIDENATCDKPGNKSYHCELCDTVKPESKVVIEATGHTEELIPAVAATCNEAGLTEGVRCSVCKEALTPQKEIPAKKHLYGDWIVNSEPGCKTDGQRYRVCINDGCTDKQIEDFEATGHDYDEVKAACNDIEKKVQCRVCKEFITVEVEGLGHDWGEWTVKYEPACTVPGVKSRMCRRENCRKEETEAIAALEHRFISYNRISLRANTVSDGEIEVRTYCDLCSDKDHASVTERIPIYAAKTVKLSYTSTPFTGGVKAPSVKVTDRKGKSLVKGTDYTVKYVTGRKNVGKYKVTITFKGNYKGTAYSYFKINPKGVGISKLTKAKKSFKVTWKKPTSKYRKQMTGYQIKYSTNSKMTSAKTIRVNSTTATSKTIKSLKAKKKYYVQIRTYKKIGSNYYYSGWSTKKTVTTK